MILKKLLAVLIITAFTCSFTYASQNDKPRVAILATGGTIAGSAATSVDASYQPGVLSINEILKSVPDLEKVAQLTGIQICNISSQNMEEKIWLQLLAVINDLFEKDLCDGIVITHGTDTMEETAYFLNLTVKHSRPVVLTGAMRPSTSLSADGPLNLYNAVVTAASANAHNRGVMVLMNDVIFSADDVTKSHTVGINAFSSFNFGPLGFVRDGITTFNRNTNLRHTVNSEFDISNLTTLPVTEIIYSYAFSSDAAIKGVIESNAKGIVIAGVGHGNYNRAIASAMEEASSKGIVVVRSARIHSGGVDFAAEEYSEKWPVSLTKSPQKARILLMLALTQTNDPKEIQRIFTEY